MNSVMGIGEKILFIYKGEKLWEGTKDEITRSTVKELDDFVFANKVMNSLRGKSLS
jgi:phospholipid/cholesterol/gamma-HCH transport system ATP-binding protein